MVSLIEILTSGLVLDTACGWLCQRRKDFPDQDDIWWFRFHWAGEKPRIRRELKSGVFLFSPQKALKKADGGVIHLWSATDALPTNTWTAPPRPRNANAGWTHSRPARAIYSSSASRPADSASTSPPPITSSTWTPRSLSDLGGSAAEKRRLAKIRANSR